MIKARPLTVIAFGIIAGAVFADLSYRYENIWIFLIFPISLIIVTAVVYLAGRADSERQRGISFVSLVISVCFAIGYVNYDLETVRFQNSDIDVGRYEVSGKVDRRTERNNYTELIIDEVKVRGEGEYESDYKMRVYVYMDDELKADIGDEIAFSAKVNSYGTMYNGEVNHDMILDGIKTYCSVQASKVMKEGSDPNIFEGINIAVREKLRSIMSYEEFSLSYAMLTGNSGYIPTEVIEKFRAGGIAHIFAVSGLHIGFLFGAIYFVIKRIKSAWIKFGIAMPILIFYTAICGFTPSCMRAVIMCGVFMTAQFRREKYDALNSLLLSAVILLTISPMYLYDVGFILSYTCVLSIIVMMPVIRNALKFLPRKINNSLSLVMSVQIGVLPLNLVYFNFMSPLSLMINMLVVPLISVVFVILLVTLIISLIIPIAGHLMYFPEFCIKYIKLFITKFEYEMISISDVEIGSYIFCYYALLLLCSYHINLRRPVRLFFIFLFSAILVAGLIQLNIGVS